MSSSTPTSAPEPPPLRFDGLHIRDKHGSNVASVRAEVTRRGVTLVGKKGTLGSFPFQSIGSWAHASDTTLSLIVTANGAQREVVVAGDPATITAVLAAIDATVNDIIEEMTKPGGSAEKIARDEPVDARYATPAPSDDGSGSGSGSPDDHDAGVDWRALAEKTAATSPTSPIAPGEESLRAEDRRRASLAEADAAAAQAEARRAAVAEAAAEARVAAAERRAEVAEARAEAAERRARDYAAAASLDVTPNPESEPGDGSALPAAARLAETTSRLESSESLIKALGEELERARAEADAARASARQLASSAATNAAAAAAHYQTQSGRVAESPVAESSEDAAVAAATAVAMRSHAEAEDLRLLLESAETDARRHAERADAAVSDAETAWARAAEAHEGTRALADELKRAKRAADDARVEGERALRRAERAASAARERDASKLEAANAVARRLGREKGDLEGETARLRAELEAAHRARDTSQRHLDAAAAASLRRRDEAASLAKRLEDAETDARRHAERADVAETELEDVRKSAEDVSRKLDAHARDGEAEAAASVSERRRLAEALRCASAERDVAENVVADAEARAAAAEGERDGLAARVATLVTRMEETTREANARVAAAEERARVAVAEADEAKRAELGTRAELDAARAARDALAADVRASRGDAERHAASTQAVREMTSAAEAALARAADAERDAAAEVVSLRKEASARSPRGSRRRGWRRREDANEETSTRSSRTWTPPRRRCYARRKETRRRWRPFEPPWTPSPRGSPGKAASEKAASESPSSRKPRKVSNDRRSPRRRCSRIARRRRAWTRLEFRRCRSDRSRCPRGRRPVDTRRGFPKSRRAQTASRGSNPRLLGFETRNAHPPSPRRRWRRARRRIARALEGTSANAKRLVATERDSSPRRRMRRRRLRRDARARPPRNDF